MPPAPRVLRIITRLNIGGPSLQAARLTTALRAIGYDTTLVHGRVGDREGEMRDLLPPDDAAVRFVPSLRRPLAPGDDWRAFRQLSAILREVRPAIVHTHMAKAGLLGRLATLAYNQTVGRAQRARIVHTYHGHVLEGYFSAAMTAAVIQAERGLARGSDALVAISPRIREELAGRYRIAPAEKFRVIPLGFDLAPFAAITDETRADARRRLNVPPKALVVSTVGRLTAIKHHELLLEAAREIAAAQPRAIFLIAGDGELRPSLEARAHALGLAERVRWLGWRRDLPTVYGATDVFVLTSRNEGTPVALIEAMAAGVPGVATAVGGVPDVLTDDSMGLLVPPDAAAAIAAAVIRLLSSEQARREMGRQARQAVLARYDATRLVSDVDALYRSLIG
jgi:glycosyltransferase involved in cell wall biosynthesis